MQLFGNYHQLSEILKEKANATGKVAFWQRLEFNINWILLFVITLTEPDYIEVLCVLLWQEKKAVQQLENKELKACCLWSAQHPC